jgi:hypothetical protein
MQTILPQTRTTLNYLDEESRNLLIPDEIPGRGPQTRTPDEDPRTLEDIHGVIIL